MIIELTTPDYNYYTTTGVAEEIFFNYFLFCPFPVGYVVSAVSVVSYIYFL